MSSETETETKFCSNCKKNIAKVNFTMHEMHCLRHLMLCEHCQEPIPRSERDQHFNDVHAKVPCTLCGVEMEKDHLDTHMETACPKRKVACQYCELEMPQLEMKNHLEYCGTRTEPCKKCGTFIMLRDQLRHTASNCAYPEPEPPNKTFIPDPLLSRFFEKSGPAAANHQNHDESFLLDRGSFLDPFSFVNMMSELGQDGGGFMPSLVVEDSDASAAAPAVPYAGHRGVDIRRVTGASRAANAAQQRHGDTSGSRKSFINKKSGLNRQRERETVIPPDIDYDTMLARQLAAEDDEDLDSDAHINHLLMNYEKHSRPNHVSVFTSDDNAVEPASPPSHNEFAAADEDMIPCEFCNVTFPAYALVHHQSVCDPLASGLWREAEDVSYQRSRNNELLGNNWRPAGSHTTIPVINNLVPASTAHPSEEPENHQIFDDGDHDMNSLENLMLPCEFCKDLLPADVLPHHQALCEANQFSISDPWTSAAAQPSAADVMINRNHFFPTSGVSSRQRHQPDPTEELLSIMSKQEAKTNQEAKERAVPVIFPSSQPRPKKQPNLPGKQPDWIRLPAPSHAKGKDFRTSLTQNRGASPGLQPDEPQDFSLHDRRGARSGQSGNEKSSWVQNTLNELVTVDDVPVYQVQEEGRTRRSRVVAHKQVPSTSVTARTVARKMERDNRRNPQNSQRTTADMHLTPRGVEEVGPGGRQRERGDHVFNSTNNARTQPSHQRPRRPSNRQLPSERE